MKTQLKFKILSLIVGLGFIANNVYALDMKRAYVNVEAGPALQNDLGVERVSGLPVSYANPRFSFDLGYRIDASVGYRVTEAMSVELNTGFAYNTVKGYRAYYIVTPLSRR